MGSFDGSCAITGTAIQAGEPVLQVVKYRDQFISQLLDKRDLREETCTTYDLKQMLHEAVSGQGGPMNRLLREIVFFRKYGRMAEVGEIDHIGLLDTLFEDRSLLVRWGTYDDYGWVTDYGDYLHPDEYGSYVQFMVHRPVAEAIAQAKGQDPADLFGVLRQVVYLAYRCRIHLWHTGPVGEQNFSAEEYQAHQLRLRLIEGQLKARMDEWRRESFDLPKGVEL